MNTPLDANSNRQSFSGLDDCSLHSTPDAQTGGLSVQQWNEQSTLPVLETSWTQESSAELEFEDALPILVVDDLPVNRKLIGAQLRKLGYKVDYAEDGESALNKVRAEHYGLVFMDLEMPVMDGYDAAIAIRQIDFESGQHTPIIGMTSYDRSVERESCVSSGMDDYVSKGISAKNLERLMQQYLRKREQLPVVRSGQALSKTTEDSVFIDIELLQGMYSQVDSEEVLDMNIGTIKTFLGCLRCAFDDRDVASVGHFVQSMKVPCTTLGLGSMLRVSSRIAHDVTVSNWQDAMQGMEVLESQYSQILDQLTGISAAHHRSV